MDSTEHDVLLRQAMAGDRGAFKALINAHGQKLIACVNVYLGAARSHADDVLQETMLAAWQSLPNYRSEQGSFEAWLLGVGIHKAKDKLRKLVVQRDQARGKNAGAETSVPGLSQIPDEQTTPSKVVAHQERNELLNDAVQQLDERQRMAIAFHALEKLTYAETADMMSLLLETTITEGKVKNYVREGKKRLKQLLPRESAIFSDVAPKPEK